MKSPKRNVWYLGLVSFFNEIASQMIYPMIPDFLVGLGASKSLIGLIEGIAEATAALFKTVSGRLSDKWKNRKGFVYAGYILAGIAKPFLYLAGAWPHVLGVRFADRMGKAIRGPARDALLSTSVKSEVRGKSFGLQRAMDKAGAVVGPLVAMGILWMAPDNLRLVFLLSVIPAVLAVVFIPFVVENKEMLAPKGKALPQTDSKPLNRAFVVFLVANIIFTLGNSSNAFLLLKARETGISLLALPLLWMVYNLCCTIFAPIFGSLSDQWGRKPVIVASFLYYALVYVGFAFAESPMWIWLLFAGYGVYYGLSAGVFKAYIAGLVPAGKRGTAYGIFQTGIGLALLPASVIMGGIWDAVDSQTAFLYAAGMSLLGFLVFWVGSRLPTT